MYRNEIELKDQFVAALLKNGADIDYQNDKGEYALLVAGKTKKNDWILCLKIRYPIYKLPQCVLLAFFQNNVHFLWIKM